MKKCGNCDNAQDGVCLDCEGRHYGLTTEISEDFYCENWTEVGVRITTEEAKMVINDLRFIANRAEDKGSSAEPERVLIKKLVKELKKND